MTEKRRAQPQFTTPNWRAMIGAMVHILERKDPYTRGHSQRVQALVDQTTKILSTHDPEVWNQYLCECASVASLFHDIGKLVVDKATLLNQNPVLTPEQRHELIDHPYEGAVIAHKIFPQEVVMGIFSHHERWDGQIEGLNPGYPLGLAGENITPIGRLIHICDAFDAMTTLRSYNVPMSKEQAADRLTAEAGKQFDPNYVKVFVEQIVPQL